MAMAICCARVRGGAVATRLCGTGCSSRRSRRQRLCCRPPGTVMQLTSKNGRCSARSQVGEGLLLIGNLPSVNLLASNWQGFSADGSQKGAAGGVPRPCGEESVRRFVQGKTLG